MDYLIRKGKIEDTALIKSFILQENDYMSSFNLPNMPLINSIEKEIENQNVYVLKKGRNLLGLAIISKSIIDSYFSFSKSSQKEFDLLYSLPWNGEETLIISYFAVDPNKQNKGLGKMLLKALKAKYKGYLFLTCFNRFNNPYINFLTENNFIGPMETLGFEISEKSAVLYYLPYKKEGICSDPIF
ncbi:MAG TPA: hypothetical protein DEF61_03130 [Firmicutes bacterium]|nr:hypothetical protein [Bacillota bacterium]HBX25250.1 hypothetical protein [Bacillota bacterium]